jgi:hypothetical protein
MADAPAGSKWSPVEVILALVLIIAILSRIKGVSPSIIPKEVSQQPQTQTPIKKPVQNIPKTSCGLMVYRPKPLETVSGTIVLNGIVTGCGWNATRNTALYVQVIDDYGYPLTEYLAVPISGENDKGTLFYESIVLSAPTQRKKGYVLFFPASSDSTSTRQISSRIPISFK